MLTCFCNDNSAQAGLRSPGIPHQTPAHKKPEAACDSSRVEVITGEHTISTKAMIIDRVAMLWLLRCCCSKQYH